MSVGRQLYVCDFDWSLVEENSDTWVLGKLGATAIFQRLKATGSFLPGSCSPVKALHTAPGCMLRRCRPAVDAADGRFAAGRPHGAGQERAGCGGSLPDHSPGSLHAPGEVLRLVWFFYILACAVQGHSPS